jgi:hypothetical protein
MNSNLLEISFPSFTSAEDKTLRPLNPLEPIRLGFFIPRLSNKPQDPIVDALDLEQAANEQRRKGGYAPSADNIQLQPKLNGHAPSREKSDELIKLDSAKERNLNDVWMAAATGSQATGVRSLNGG